MEPDRRQVGIGSMPVTLTDRDGRILYEGRVYGIPIREVVILLKSEEFFNDPDPCYKHRGAVYVRLWTEFEQFLTQAGDGPVRIDRLPDTLRGYIELGEAREVAP